MTTEPVGRDRARAWTGEVLGGLDRVLQECGATYHLPRVKK